MKKQKGKSAYENKCGEPFSQGHFLFFETSFHLSFLDSWFPYLSSSFLSPFSL